MASANVLSTIRDRLVIMHGEVTGILSSHKEEQVRAFDHTLLPLVTHGVVGFDFTSNPSSTWTGTATFQALVYVADTMFDEHDASGVSKALVSSTDLMDAFIDYHVQHPKFSTDSLDPLANIGHPVTYSTRAAVIDLGKSKYVGFRIEITVENQTFRREGI